MIERPNLKYKKKLHNKGLLEMLIKCRETKEPLQFSSSREMIFFLRRGEFTNEKILFPNIVARILYIASEYCYAYIVYCFSHIASIVYLYNFLVLSHPIPF